MKTETFRSKALLIGFAAATLLASCVFTSGVAAQETLNGRVVDSAGTAIPNAVVSLAELRLATTTSGGGTFAFPAGPGRRFTLVARRGRFAPAAREIGVS